MHAQFGVDHGIGVVTHPAGADRMENRRADTRGGFVQVFFALQAVTGQVLDRFERLQGRRGDNAPGQANGIGGDSQIFRMAKVIGLDQRRFLRIGRADFHPATALRTQVADRRGERRERVQRFAETLERQRLHVVFKIG
ncbi:hypothetical protein D3C87_1325630 [compost metagenome]